MLRLTAVLCFLGLAIAGGAASSVLFTDGSPADVLRLRWYPILVGAVVGAVGLGLAIKRSRAAVPMVAIAGLLGISGYAVQMTAFALAPYLAERTRTAESPLCANVDETPALPSLM